MNILITGGAGFIGKHLAELLIKKGHKVTIFDNFSNSSIDSLKHLTNLDAKMIKGDITKIVEIQDALKEQEIIIHLAAKISVEESIKNPSETFEINVNGTKNVILSAEKNNIKKIIFASSAAVYGETTNYKINESVKTNPISPYGESKLEMEQIINKYCLCFKINYIILRFFNIYGIGQTKEYAGVISKFEKFIKHNKPLEIFGNGEQSRDFVSINDVIDSIYCSISYDKNGIFNIASGKNTTIKNLAETMIALSGKNIGIKFNPPKIGDIKFSQADITLATNNLGYTPKIELKDGLKEILQ